MSSSLDDHGQPLARAFNSARTRDRDVDELIGLCRGVLADGAVAPGEAEFLLDWLQRHRDVTDRWPADRLYLRLREMLVDRTLDPDEQGELLLLLRDITGGTPGQPLAERVASLSSSLPLCTPPPLIVFPQRHFCLTGRFIYGTRKQCETEITRRGGIAQSGPTRATAYVVIGVIGSTDWIHSSYGRKIESAVELRENGQAISLVGEEHWTKALAASGA